MSADDNSRRAILLAGAALAGAAISTPAARGESSKCSYPDLAGELSAMYRRLVARLHHDRLEQQEFEARVFEATGLQGNQWPLDDEGFIVTLNKMAEHADDADGGSNAGWDEMFERMTPLCQKIISLPTNTVGDLALQARAVGLLNYHICLSRDEAGPEGFVTLIENACKLAGIEAMPAIGGGNV